MSYAAHQRHAAKASPRVRFAVLTVSDSRTPATDESGDAITRRLGDRHQLVGRDLVPDRVTAIRTAADRLLRAGADVLVVHGGTGITPRDVTVEALAPWFRKELPGFGEHFRRLSADLIGSGAWLSRAAAGTVERRGRAALVVLLPGSPEACRLAVDRVLLPELAHVSTLLRGGAPHA